MAETRAERLAARTAQMIAAHPEAYVVRTQTSAGGGARLALRVGLTFASPSRSGHLVVDSAGLRMYQGLDDVEWDKPWREITGVRMSPDGRSIELDAIGWHAPKHYSPCRPTGDVLLPEQVRQVAARIREYSIGRTRESGQPG